MNKSFFVYINNTKKYQLLNLLVDTPIIDIYEQFWNIGIHYYKSNDSIQTNYWNTYGIVFCGEIFSNTQGWIEGSIQSINNLSN